MCLKYLINAYENHKKMLLKDELTETRTNDIMNTLVHNFKIKSISEVYLSSKN